MLTENGCSPMRQLAFHERLVVESASEELNHGGPFWVRRVVFLIILNRRQYPPVVLLI